MKQAFAVPVAQRRWYPLLLVLSLLLVWPAAAWSHAHPEQRVPDANAKLQKAPSEVKIRFTEELEPAFSTLKVTDRQGHPVNDGDSQVPNGKPRLLVAPLKSLAPGTYTVRWHVVARDGHTTQGHYTFEVESASSQ